MLSYKNRFHGYNALRYVYKNGHVERGRLCVVKSVANKHRKTPRISVVVSKKVIKSAVARNRIRRRLYELFRTELPLLDESRDIVCIVTSADVRTLPHTDLAAELKALLTASDLYKTH